MILIDIYDAETKKSYDFKVDENTETEMILAELLEIIAQKERLQSGRRQQGEAPFLLCDTRRGVILDPGLTLAENRVGSGTSLLLI